MKNIKCKLLMVFISIIVFFIINPKTVNASQKYDYVLLGDSFTVGMYASFTGEWSHSIIEKNATINGKNVMFMGAGGYGHDYWFNRHYSEIKIALNNLKNGAPCIIWLGGNDLANWNKYPESVNSMANEFRNIKFYFVSYQPAPGDEPYTKQVDEFNEKVLERLKRLDRFNKNLYFKDINSNKMELNNEKKSLYEFIMDRNYMPPGHDPYHLTPTLYTAMWNQIMSKLSPGSDTSSMAGRTFVLSSLNDEGEERRSTTYTDYQDNIEYYSDVSTDDIVGKEKTENMVGKILGVITNIGIIISVLMIAILGIKYIISQKINSKDMIPYVIGVIMLFSISVIIKIIFAVAQSI